jgi:hypothetical protein
MDVAARHALDLGMAPDHRAERLAVLEPLGVHALDAGLERRMVHEDQRGARRRLGQPRVQPGQSRGAQAATALPRHQRVEPDQP